MPAPRATPILAVLVACGAAPRFVVAERSPASPAAPEAAIPTAIAEASPPARRARLAVGEDHEARFEAGSAVALTEGDRVLAVKALGPGRVALVGMAPGEAVLHVVEKDGRAFDVTVEVAGRGCPAREVPLFGLAVVEDARMYRDATNGAGKLHVTATDAVVTFDRPGALLLQTEAHDGARRCTLFTSGDEAACARGVALAVGARAPVALPKPTSSFVVAGGAGRVELADGKASFVAERAGRAAAWVRDERGAWACTTFDVR